MGLNEAGETFNRLDNGNLRPRQKQRQSSGESLCCEGEQMRKKEGKNQGGS